MGNKTWSDSTLDVNLLILFGLCIGLFSVVFHKRERCGSGSSGGHDRWKLKKKKKGQEEAK